MTRVMHSIALLAVASTCSWGKVAVVFRLASPPLPVVAGQHFGLCAANVGTVNTDLTLPPDLTGESVERSGEPGEQPFPFPEPDVKPDN